MLAILKTMVASISQQSDIYKKMVTAVRKDDLV